MRPTSGQIADLVRTLAGDFTSKRYQDDTLIGTINSVYSDVQADLAAAGVVTMTREQEVALDAAQTVLSVDSDPALPSDLIVPYRLWEKATASSNKFTPMSKFTNGLPDMDMGQALLAWEWDYQQINFIGSTQAITIKIRYEYSLTAMTLTEVDGVATDLCQINDSLNVMAYGTLVKLGLARFDDDYQKALFQLKARTNRAEQRKARRRAPYGLRGYATGSRRF